MPDSERDRYLEELLGRIRILVAHPIDFRRSDFETTQAKVRLLVASAAYFNVLSLTDFGGRLGPEREPGLVEQVIASAFQTYAGYDPHPEPFEKAAMLLRGITQGHPFNDGNKRTGFLTVSYYLQFVGFPLPDDFSAAEMEELSVRISAGAVRDVGEIARALERLWRGTH